jgi:Thioredoxin-like [2Fe-2S] ferredoxin/NADH-dependant formate dehydrogenase delta subunit FdsD
MAGRHGLWRPYSEAAIGRQGPDAPLYPWDSKPRSGNLAYRARDMSDSEDGALGAAVRRLVAEHAGDRGPLMPVLHDLQHELGYVPPEAVPLLARELNLSRAEVHGVVTFYRDFRSTPAEAVAAITAHVTTFWEPRMIAELTALARRVDPGLVERARAAAQRLASPA